MKVTIITATYNSEFTMKSCIESVVNQDYNDIEYLIIDGASTDNTLEILKEAAAKYVQIKYTSAPDKGIYDALNKGIATATGDIIGFVHSDDFLANYKIITNIVATFKNQHVDGVYGDLQYVALDDTDKVIRNWVSKPFDIRLLKKGWMPAHPTLYLKKSLYESFGNFDISFKIAADYEFILRIFKQPHLKFAYVPEIITKMRVGGASNKNLRNLIQKTKEDYKALKQHRVGGMWSVFIKNISKLEQFLVKKTK